MDEILKRDQNSAVVLGGVTDDIYQYIRMLRVDPVSGRLLISDSGGGGPIASQEIDFTGAVNGVNTSFAGLQPTYIVAYGIWLKALDNNGNTQWSWSGGTLTMQVPPQSSLYGF